MVVIEEMDEPNEANDAADPAYQTGCHWALAGSSMLRLRRWPTSSARPSAIAHTISASGVSSHGILSLTCSCALTTPGAWRKLTNLHVRVKVKVELTH